MNKKPKRYKYKLKIDDSFMSELAVDLGLNNPTDVADMDVINPDNTVAVDILNPTPVLTGNESQFSSNVDKEVGLKLSTKLQNLINTIGDALYVLLEKARNDGDYMVTKNISGGLDYLYSLLKFVNYEDVSQVDYALLEVLRISEEFEIEIPEDLKYESIYKVDITLNDGLEYNEEEKKLEYEKGMEELNREKNSNSKAAITRDRLPIVKEEYWKGVNTLPVLIDKLKTIQGSGNNSFDELLEQLENFNTSEKSDDFMSNLVIELVRQINIL